MSAAVNLRVVRTPFPEPERARRDAPDAGEFLLLATLLLLNLVPVVGELARLGRWSPAIVGFAAGAVVLTGRELWSQLHARTRAKTGRRE